MIWTGISLSGDTQARDAGLVPGFFGRPDRRASPPFAGDTFGETATLFGLLVSRSSWSILNSNTRIAHLGVILIMDYSYGSNVVVSQ
jgi:hypothetical protein